MQYLFFCDEDIGTLFQVVADTVEGSAHTPFCKVSRNGVADLFAGGESRSSAAARSEEDNGRSDMPLVRIVVKIAKLTALSESLETF